MTHIIKKGPIKVSTQPKDFDLQATGLVFKSYDNQIALEFNVAQQDGTPADLLGANLRLLMFIYDEVDGTIKKEPIPFITKNLITESFLNGHVVYILPEAMKAYNGMVEAYVYIEYPDGSTSDNLGFTFRMKRSAIDGLAQDKADYFIEDFKQLLAAASLEANKVVEGLDQEIKNLQQATKDANTAVDGAMNRIDGLEAEIGQLERLREMYIDTLDFGSYDYSGNPNLMVPLKAKDFAKNPSVAIEDSENSLKVTFADSEGAKNLTSTKNIPALLPNTQYTLSADVTVLEGYKGNLNSLRLTYRKSPGGTVLIPLTVGNVQVGKKTKISATANSSAATDPSQFDRMYFSIGTASTEPFIGTVLIENIKLERGSTTTPYQPNLLDAPYYLSKIPLGKNIANKDVQFPITTTEYSVYSKANVEDYKVNQKYVLTMKATKPAIQQFIAYLNGDTIKAGNLTPVEGMTDVWQLVFTVTQANIDAGAKNMLAIYQYPSATKGAVQIDWLKIEKGDTRTPNISQFKYFGEGLKDSNNPNDYRWDITPEYTEKGLNDAVNVYDPQRVEGLKNFADGIQIAGDKVISENDCTVYTLTKDNSQSFIDGYATFIKHGKEVIVNGTVKFKKAYAFGVPLDDKVPDEFIARIVHGMLTGQSGTNSVSKAMYVQKDLGKIMTNSEFAANEWFTFNGHYWVGGK
ncbi:BppU family phage baseplate upper protein [Enterococcus faecium]